VSDGFADRSEAVKQYRGCGETRFACQCSLGDADKQFSDKQFSTGRASGTQNKTDKLFL